MPPHPRQCGSGMQVGSLLVVLAWTYERAKASAKAADKNKSCAGERDCQRDLAIGAGVKPMMGRLGNRRVTYPSW